MRVLLTLSFLLSTLLLPGCPKQCKVKTARCHGTVTQLCRPDGKWQDVVDCAKIDPKVPWSCVCQDPQVCRCKKPAAP